MLFWCHNMHEDFLIYCNSLISPILVLKTVKYHSITLLRFKWRNYQNGLSGELWKSRDCHVIANNKNGRSWLTSNLYRDISRWSMERRPLLGTNEGYQVEDERLTEKEIDAIVTVTPERVIYLFMQYWLVLGVFLQVHDI